MIERSAAPAGGLEQLSERSLAARYWKQPGYRYSCISIHDPRVSAFWYHHPFVGWSDVQVGDLAVAMLMANDDGVALIYHAFGPDAYEAASVAAWVAIARSCRQIIDVGAFTGVFALLAKKAAPDALVLAVEPNSASRARLHTNLVWNGMHDSVQVAPFAVAAELQTLPLFVPMGADVLDTGSSLQRGESVTRTELVTAGPIDLLVQQYRATSPDLIKIDVEGLEEAALQGASLALENRATVILEIQSPELFRRCESILTRFGYRIFAIDDDNLTLQLVEPEGSVEAWFETHVRGRALNYLCVAREDHLALAREGVARVHALLGS